jgi:ATP-dependent Clp protease ATP-binding subunit ClpC
VFERYTEAARQVVVLAQEEARTLGHRHIGAEHLLLGVVRVEPAILPARAQDIRARIGRGPGETPAYTPFTEGAQAALGRAPGEADALGQGAVRPGHILLALAQEPEAVLASGAHADRIRIDALRRLASGPQDFDLDATIVAGGAVPVWLGAPDLPIGDLGHPRVDGRLLLAMLAKDGRSAALLREHGLDEGTVRARLGP